MCHNADSSHLINGRGDLKLKGKYFHKEFDKLHGTMADNLGLKMDLLLLFLSLGNPSHLELLINLKEINQSQAQSSMVEWLWINNKN